MTTPPKQISQIDMDFEKLFYRLILSDNVTDEEKNCLNSILKPMQGLRELSADLRRIIAEKDADIAKMRKQLDDYRLMKNEKRMMFVIIILSCSVLLLLSSLLLYGA